ncbi:MAG: hypothetical protein R3200_17450, partial [Xanthomonadales bacterium]|nr:hypothetical protein [Xanthomonadales bacterium]
NSWYQRSETSGVHRGQEAYGAQLAYPNDRFDWYVDWRRIEINFNPALGFVNRSGVRQVDGQWRWRNRLDEGRWQWLGARLQYFRSDRLGGGLQSQSAYLNVLEGFSRSNDFFTVFVGQQKEGLLQPFEIFEDIVIPADDYAFDRYGFYLETGEHRTLSGTLEVVDGDFFGGSNLLIAPSLNWRPTRHFFAGLDYAVNRIDLPPGEFHSRLYRLRANIAFNADWAWLNFIQGDNVSDTISINSRLRWEPRPDREYFLVFNQVLGRDGYDVLDTEVALKARFNIRF